MRKIGIALVVAGALMTVPIPAVRTLLHFRHIETLPNPTPEDIRAGVTETQMTIAAGILLSLAGAFLLVKSSKPPPR